ncbi:MAG: 1,4-alpha-glucan branching protein GlgB, partial [Oscillospiraceae bacterium]|nr:1,4-alpha-glucan branching protein GlgB [Oscillospiraceae bacterium]
MKMTDVAKRFAAGKYYDCHRYFGAHAVKNGVRFRVWAPGVKAVYVTGSFCGWKENEHPMAEKTPGIWECCVRSATEGDLYKFVIDCENGERLFKADPVAFAAEKQPGTASVYAGPLSYRWRDGEWMKSRSALPRPMNIYELHLGSWLRGARDGFPDYDELADRLSAYAAEMGYTHVELMPVTEHPYDGSWGYQTTGYFAPTSRYGTPKGLMRLVDRLHRAGIGVIMDWAGGHFCRDGFALGRFNGGALYEGADHQQWGTYKFDFSRGEVRSFLISSVMYWLGKYHVDGIRVDGVTSMLFLNFGVFTEDNIREGSVDRDAVLMLTELNRAVRERFPTAFTVAEESTDWPHVTGEEGLGFSYKWDMGWMNDTLEYFSLPFYERPRRHGLLNFSMMYAFSERFILPLSHDEVVHGKRSLIGRMPGSYEQKFMGLRLLMLYQLCHPGAKLNFMGSEIAQFAEWDHEKGVEWFMTDYPAHREHREFVRALNAFYLKESCLWEKDGGWDGFEWIDADDAENCVVSFVRKGTKGFAVVV